MRLMAKRAALAAMALAMLTISGVAGAPAAFAEARPAVYVKKGAAVAIGGYDLVSYFQGGGVPTPGKPEFKVVHAGVTYQFASAANRDAFRASPARYLPAYGGYCAWAVAENKIAPGNPLFYKVVNGRLYFNFDRGVQKKWEKDIPGFIQKANANWPAVLNKGGLWGG